MAQSAGEYYVGQLGPRLFSVVKFTDGAEPSAKYVLDLSVEGAETCTCPAFTTKRVPKPCKHFRLLQAWLDKGEPQGAILESEF